MSAWSDHCGRLPMPLMTTVNDPREALHPRPPGVIRPESVKGAVLEQLQSHPAHWQTRASIVWRTGRTGHSVDWALLFPCRIQLNGSEPDISLPLALQDRLRTGANYDSVTFRAREALGS